MANKEHLQSLIAALSSMDCALWNQWRKANPNLKPDLSGAQLSNVDLHSADLSDTNMSRANLANANLVGANLNGTNLIDANLRGANLSNSDLKCAHLRRTDLSGANLTGADLRYADLRGADLTGAELRSANLNPEDLKATIHVRADPVNLRGTRQHGTFLAKSQVAPNNANRPGSTIGVSMGRLAKAISRLFRRQEVATLGLSGRNHVKESESRGNEAAPRHSGKQP